MPTGYLGVKTEKNIYFHKFKHLESFNLNFELWLDKTKIEPWTKWHIMPNAKHGGGCLILQAWFSLLLSLHVGGLQEHFEIP